MIVAFLAALIGGIGHATSLEQSFQFGVVALVGAATAAGLLVTPIKRLGVGPLLMILGANQLLIHLLCMWKTRVQAAPVHATHHLHMHAAHDPWTLRMLIVHAIAMFVGVILLVRAEQLLWRMTARMVAGLMARVRGVVAPLRGRARPSVLLAPVRIERGRTRMDVWSCQVTSRRGPPEPCVPQQRGRFMSQDGVLSCEFVLPRSLRLRPPRSCLPQAPRTHMQR